MEPAPKLPSDFVDYVSCLPTIYSLDCELLEGKVYVFHFYISRSKQGMK